MTQKDPALILIVLILAGVILFAPLPYYQQAVCTPSYPAKCYPAGWKLGYSFWDKLTGRPAQPVSQSIQKPSSAEEYCKSINTKDQIVQLVTDCGEYKIVDPGCCDIPQGILDKNWSPIASCGGWIAWSQECLEKYPRKDSCIKTSCREVNQKAFEETYCTKDEDCGVSICSCSSKRKDYIKPVERACTRVCNGQAKCFNNKCSFVPTPRLK